MRVILGVTFWTRDADIKLDEMIEEELIAVASASRWPQTFQSKVACAIAFKTFAKDGTSIEIYRKPGFKYQLSVKIN